MAEETKNTGSALGKLPLGRLAARVSFYLGVICLGAAVLYKYALGIPEWLKMTPAGYTSMGVVWFLITITILLAEIDQKLTK